MKLVFNRAHKSIGPFLPIELPPFTVLTGVNGAGKSHLLEAIESNFVSVQGITANQPNGPHPIRRFDWASLVPHDTGAFSGSQISSEQSSLWNEIVQIRIPHLQSLRDQLQRFQCAGLNKCSSKELWKLEIINLKGLGLTDVTAQDAFNVIRQHTQDSSQHISSLFLRNDPNRSRLIQAISSSSIPLFALDDDDFYNIYPKTWHPVDLFQQSFARLFSAYQRLWQQNQLKVRGRVEDASVVALSDAEFIAKHGRPPWEFLNEVLEAAELDFRINEPHKWEDRPYEPKLCDSSRGIQIKFNDLSSGERILMSFALCLYHAGSPESGADFPRVLLFDEIDAILHPSMTRSLLRTIQTTLVEKHQIQVLLTTHSPSTVALAPDDSIYVMRKSGEARIERTSKDVALGVLTAGVPTLSVNYENRRQVFVESKYDVKFYSELYQRAKQNLLPEVSLMFISSGVGGQGNCDQVAAVVKQLVQGGNRTVRGVIDWDLSNRTADQVFVLGEGERYSIENYILDPLLIALLLLREKLLDAQDLGFPSTFRYIEVHNQPSSTLQAVADHVANLLNHSATTGTTSYRYIGGAGIQIPTSIARMQGHQLEALLKSTFPQLNRFQREPDLKLAVISKVLDDFPELIPSVVVDLFKKLQE